MNRFIRIFLTLLAASCQPAIAAAQAGTSLPKSAPEYVIYDNDWSLGTHGSGYVSQPALLMLLADPNVRVLGLTATSGDCWRDEGVASLLRFLEIVGAVDIPVYNGAVLPLVNSAARHAQWESRYGKTYWSGAWNDIARDAAAHAEDPFQITAPADGMPRLKPQSQSAIAFMIDAVHRHPGQVTIYAEGPLTNIALAVRQDPEFAGLVRRIIVQGSSAISAHDDGSRAAEFNFLFDPEAADVVTTAPWRELVLLGQASDHTVLTPALRARMAKIETPGGRYATDNASVGMPLWSQLGAALIVDPAVVRDSVRAFVAVSVDHDATYGRTRTWPVEARDVVPLGYRPATIVTRVDSARLIDLYLAGLSRPVSPRRDH